MRWLRTPIRLFLLLLVCLPAFAMREADIPSVQAVVAYGRAHFDEASGLIKDAAGVPNIPEASVGYVAACFAIGQDLDQARLVLGKILDGQNRPGKEDGNFPWQGTPDAPAKLEATLYATPLLAYVARAHGATLGVELAARLKSSLDRAQRAASRVQVSPLDDTRYLLRSATRATAAAAIGGDTSAAVGEVEQWLRLVTTRGLPAGHSPTFDAVKYVALKWIHESLPEAQRPVVERALRLTALDLAGRVHPPADCLAGALTAAFPGDYTGATGFASYVLHTDFSLPLPGQIEPYLMAALLPQWRAPDSIAAITLASGLRHTRAVDVPVTATDTYVGPFYSLGTMSGQVGAATIPIFATFARSARPTLYFYCSPTPCTIQSVQADNLAICSFNFDGIGTAGHTQASLSGVLGVKDSVRGVYCYGVPWNGQPTSVGELESVAIATEECYVGITLTRTGAAANQSGALAKPAVLQWSEPDGTGNLLLTIYARQQDYAMPRPLFDLRAGVIIEVASTLTYPSLAEFAKHLTQGRLRQTVRNGRERQPDKEKPRDPNVMIPEPESKIQHVYRLFIEQSVEYTIEGRTLKLVEDLLGNVVAQRVVDGTVQPATLLWDSDFFKLEPRGDLAKALESFAK